MLTYYIVNLFAMTSLYYLIFSDYKKGLLILAAIITCSMLFYKIPIPGINLLNLIVIISIYKSFKKRGIAFFFTHGHLTKTLMYLLFITILSSIGVYLFSSIPNYNLWNTLTFAKGWFTYIFLYIIYVGEFKNDDDLRMLLKSVFIGVAIQSFISFKELIVFDRRLHGLIGNSNDLGSFFAAFIFVFIFFYKNPITNIKKMYSLVGFILAFIGLCFSLSRGAYLSFVIAVTFFIYKKSKIKLSLIMVFLLIFSTSLYSFIPQKVKTRIEGTFQKDLYSENIEIEQSAKSRIPLAIGGLLMFSESPIWGKGFGTFHLIGMNYYGDLGVTRPLVAHNMYIQILAELGLIGFTIFMIFLIKNLTLGFDLFRISNHNSYLWNMGLLHICINISFLISCIFGNRLFNGNLTAYYWILSAITFNYYEIIKKKKNI